MVVPSVSVVVALAVRSSGSMSSLTGHRGTPLSEPSGSASKPATMSDQASSSWISRR
jgi:hypothetical protein